MKLNYFFLSICITATFLILSVNLLLGPDKEEYIRVKVQPGDTIWKYAVQYREYHHFTYNEFIEWVEENNYVPAGQLKSGQIIVLPIKKDEISKDELKTVARQ